MRLNALEGTTLIDGALSSDTANATYGINVASDATLGGDGTITLSNATAELNVSGSLMAGRGGANQSLTINANVNLLSDSVLVFGLGGLSTDRDQLIRTGGTWVFQTDQQVQFFDLGFASETYTLITGLAGTVDVSQWQLVNSGAIAGYFTSDANNIYFTANVIPEPSTALLALTGLSLLFLRKRWKA